MFSDRLSRPPDWRIDTDGFVMESSDSVQVFSDKYLENISDAFKTLYNEEQLSDVTIYCREGSLKAHKLILAASSPYFCKIFRENRNDFPILILQGTSLSQLKNFIDLLYNGIADVKNEDVEALNALIREFEIKGIKFVPKTSSSNVRLERSGNSESPNSLHNKDTRFKGKKRVAVDYDAEDDPRTNLSFITRPENNERHISKKVHSDNLHVDEPVQNEIDEMEMTSAPKINISRDIKSIPNHGSDIKLTAWAKKQRKFNCTLCSSSFKRSSHLARHQLVHTGERPFPCSRCEKAFSRHDKLKHHMRRAHEYIPDSMYEKIDEYVDSDAESSIRTYSSPQPDDSEVGPTDLSTPKNLEENSPPLFTISHITSILEDSFVNPPKKGRGRPRKYPVQIPPVVATIPTIKRGRGRPPRIEVFPSGHAVQNYNITNLPYGDLNYLTREQNATEEEEEDPLVIMEPLVEINTNMDQNDDQPRNEEPNQNADGLVKKEIQIEIKTSSDLARVNSMVEMSNDIKTEQNDDANNHEPIDISEIENKIGLIGECTISVAN